MEREMGLQMAARCGKDGIVAEVLCDQLGFGSCPAAGQSLTRIAEAGGGPKIFSLLQRITDRGAALDWEVDVAVTRGIHPLFFSGCAAGNDIFVIACAESRPARELCDELDRIIEEFGYADEKTGLDGLPAELRRELFRLRREVVRKDLDLEREKIEKFQQLAMAVHGLRNPACSILSAAEFLIEDAGEALLQKHLPLLQGVVRSSLFMLKMIDDVLEISAIEGGKVKVNTQPTDLVQLINEAFLLSEGEAGRKGIELDLASDRMPVVVNLDPVKLTRVINTLLNNLIKFSHRGDRIVTEIKVNGGDASISLLNRGLSFTPDQVDTMFEPLNAGQNENGSSRTGTALELVISRRIVEAHAGEIKIESGPTNGSRFVVTLPMPAKAIGEKAALGNDRAITASAGTV